MLVFRSFALGLLGTCVMLLAFRPPYEIHFVREPPRVLYVEAPTSALIVDVAPLVPSTQLTSLVHLDTDEHVIAVDDVSVHDDLEAGARIAQIGPARHRFVDLTVAGMSGSRRVLVLLH